MATNVRVAAWHPAHGQASYRVWDGGKRVGDVRRSRDNVRRWVANTGGHGELAATFTTRRDAVTALLHIADGKATRSDYAPGGRLYR